MKKFMLAVALVLTAAAPAFADVCADVKNAASASAVFDILKAAGKNDEAVALAALGLISLTEVQSRAQDMLRCN